MQAASDEILERVKTFIAQETSQRFLQLCLGKVRFLQKHKEPEINEMMKKLKVQVTISHETAAGIYFE